jgi:hypothetical protein
MLYLLTVQIFIGIWLLVQQFRAPSPHYALAFAAWIGYMIANGMARKEGQGQNALMVTGISTLMVLVAFALGLHAGGML